MGKKYFVIIDMQKDFVNGSLANPAAAAIIPGIVEKAKALKEQGYTIVATRDTHQKNYLETQEGKKLPVEHCIEGTDGWNVVDEIAPLVDEFVNKPSFGYNKWNVFFGLGIKEDPEAIELCGTVTSICVASNATTIKATFPEVPVSVYHGLCADLNAEGHEAALTVMKAQQVNII